MSDVEIEVFPKEIKNEVDKLIANIVKITGACRGDVEKAMKDFYFNGQIKKLATGVDLSDINDMQSNHYNLINSATGEKISNVKHLHPIDSFMHALESFNKAYNPSALFKNKIFKEEKIMKVMISMPMNGKKHKQIKERMNYLKKIFESMHIEVIDSIIEETADPDTYNEYSPALFYIGESIKLLGQVDMLYMDDGWRLARGCVIEHDIAKKYGIKVIDSEFFNGVTLNIEEDDDTENDDSCSSNRVIDQAKYECTAKNFYPIGSCILSKANPEKSMFFKRYNMGKD